LHFRQTRILDFLNMAVRVVARIRPQQQQELDKDTILSTASTNDTTEPRLVKIPNPKNESEAFSFQFSSVYDYHATQQQIFDKEGKTDYKSYV